mmetsp:Transcript_14843/g.25253  ORF Transcript_14843/g.25253 Transcript_14843/m.25253 type:complete len:341 (-) Transcript_14843:911-1933(-)
MSNDDSFSNILSAQVEDKQEGEGDLPPAESKILPQEKDIEDLNLKDTSFKKEDLIPSSKKEKPKKDRRETHDPDLAKKNEEYLEATIQEIFVKGGLQPSTEMIYNPKLIQPKNPELIDEYADDDDPGFDTYVVNEENFVVSCQELARLNDFPNRAIKPDSGADMAFREKFRKKQQQVLDEQRKGALKRKKAGSQEKKLKNNDSAQLLRDLTKKNKEGEQEKSGEQSKTETEKEEEEDASSASVLPKWVKFPNSEDKFYPAEFDSVIYDCYNLRVVFDREKTGFEETKDFPIVINSIVAGRYQVVEYLGSAAFSKAIQCFDIHSEQMVCMKIIENNKDYFD